jgi:DNA-binding response OmpR family regulator
MTKGRIFLVHWNKAEAEEYAETLRRWGWDVDFEYEDGARGGTAIKLNPPAAVVIYLTRLPSHGHATAEYLAEAKSTRSIPLIFVGGESDAIEKTKAKVPSGKFISEGQLENTLAKYAKA